MKSLTFLTQSLKEYGTTWVVRRIFYEAKVRFGWLRKTLPKRPWSEDELGRWSNDFSQREPLLFARHWRNRDTKFLFDAIETETLRPTLLDILGNNGLKTLTLQADSIKKGEFTYFFAHQGKLGMPPNWRLNPFKNSSCPQNDHWTKIPMRGKRWGDIKYMWEPARFASSYILGRAYLATGDESYAETYWKLVESWAEQNPPNQGPHWKCGQECALRLMAWAFGLTAVESSPSSTPERIAYIAGLFAAQADRIEKDHTYSHLQRNNHSISEGVGLYVTGIVFPQLKRAQKWRALGLSILETEGQSLIKSDGTFSQKSHNYHRVMLHDMLYARRLAQLNGECFSETLEKRLLAACDYLLNVIDQASGQVPNFGSNDGALIFPVTTCDYTNFRSVVGSANYALKKKRVNKAGPWDEEMLWLNGHESLAMPPTPVHPRELHKEQGGIYTLHNRKSWGFTHCESFDERPSQADCLHFDLWWNGQNIAQDAGTFLYYGEPPWNNGLQGTDSHNTVSINGQDQLKRGARFMWTHWHTSQMQRFEMQNIAVKMLVGTHNGYQRLPSKATHRRSIISLGQDVWLVIDDLFGDHAFNSRLHWLLQDAPHFLETISDTHLKLHMYTPQGAFELQIFSTEPMTKTAIKRAQSSTTEGWVSRYYGKREPALSLSAITAGSRSHRYITVLSPPLNQLKVSAEKIEVIDDSTQTYQVALAKVDEQACRHQIKQMG